MQLDIKLTRILILADNDDPSISKNHFNFDKVINTQAMQTAQEPKTSQKHNGRAYGVGRTVEEDQVSQKPRAGKESLNDYKGT